MYVFRMQAVCFPLQNRTFHCRETYGFEKEDLENAVKKEKMCGRVPENSCIFAAIESCINV